MTIQGWTLILLFAVLTVALAKPVGTYLFALYEGRRTPLHGLLGPVERAFYRLGGIDPNKEQGWRSYAVHMLLFQLVLTLFTYALLRFQSVTAANAHHSYVGYLDCLHALAARSKTLAEQWELFFSTQASSF